MINQDSYINNHSGNNFSRECAEGAVQRLNSLALAISSRGKTCSIAYAFDFTDNTDNFKVSLGYHDGCLNPHTAFVLIDDVSTIILMLQAVLAVLEV